MLQLFYAEDFSIAIFATRKMWCPSLDDEPDGSVNHTHFCWHLGNHGFGPREYIQWIWELFPHLRGAKAIQSASASARTLKEPWFGHQERILYEYVAIKWRHVPNSWLEKTCKQVWNPNTFFYHPDSHWIHGVHVQQPWKKPILCEAEVKQIAKPVFVGHLVGWFEDQRWI